MNRAIESRLKRLETAAATTSGQRRLFVFEGESTQRELIASGVAREDDVFIDTGVQRTPHSYVVRGCSE